MYPCNSIPFCISNITIKKYLCPTRFSLALKESFREEGESKQKYMGNFSNSVVLKEVGRMKSPAWAASSEYLDLERNCSWFSITLSADSHCGSCRWRTIWVSNTIICTLHISPPPCWGCRDTRGVWKGSSLDWSSLAASRTPLLQMVTQSEPISPNYCIFLFMIISFKKAQIENEMQSQWPLLSYGY